MKSWSEVQSIKEWLREYNFKDVPSMGSGWYVSRPLFPFYTWSKKYLMTVKVEEPPFNKTPFGWILQFRLKDWEVEWSSSKKVYNDYGTAIHALMQKEKDDVLNGKEFRIKPIYIYDNQEWRDYQVSQIIEK